MSKNKKAKFNPNKHIDIHGVRFCWPKGVRRGSILNFIRKGLKEFQFWNCKIIDGKVIKSGSKPIYEIHSFSDTAIWKNALSWKNSIYHNGYFSEDSIKSNFPILLIQENEPWHKGSSSDVIRESIIDERLNKRKISREFPILNPKVVIDESGIVWKLNPDKVIIKDDNYYKEQIEFLKNECNSRINKTKNSIEYTKNQVKGIEDGKIKDDNGSSLRFNEEWIQRANKDVDFYSAELERLSKIKV